MDFFGISNYLKAYKLYNPNTKKIVISWDHFFYEVDFWTWSNNGVKKNIIVDLDGDNKKKQKKKTYKGCTTTSRWSKHTW